MGDYHDLILNNPEAELVHISADNSDADAEKWALDEKFPWPTVLRSNISEDLLARVGQNVPGYFLYNPAGELLAKGKEAALAKIK